MFIKDISVFFHKKKGCVFGPNAFVKVREFVLIDL